VVKSIKGDMRIDPYVSLVCVMIRPNIQEANEHGAPEYLSNEITAGTGSIS
tara:strand:- start:321 stop:473 length:153 start_codon:yes stop_codon:yes gene_type:complete